MNQFLSSFQLPSPIEYLTELDDNQIYIKREDLLPFSFGGNKSRKAFFFLQEILRGEYDTVVTYGSSQSNHCRVIANMCTKQGLNCWIITPQTESLANFNLQLVTLSGAHIIKCNIFDVSKTIQDTMAKLKQDKHTPFFIPGGGHHNLGTEAYLNAYSEIAEWEDNYHTMFDYIFLPSGTGTTQAGLVIGTLLHKRPHTQVIGISIAREADYGTKVIEQSIKDYIEEHNLILPFNWQQHIHFYDHYVNRIYGETTPAIRELTYTMYHQQGIAFSGTYTAKAFQGMIEYISQNNLSQNKILFLHTGATPLFFNDLKFL